MSTETNHKQSMKGVVVKIPCPNTVRISVRVTQVHPIYKKRYSLNRHYLAHFEDSKLKVGDTVVIESCRPISKLKSFHVVNRLTEAGKSVKIAESLSE